MHNISFAYFTPILLEDATLCLSLAGWDERYFHVMEDKSSRCFVHCLVLLWSHLEKWILITFCWLSGEGDGDYVR